MHVGRKPLRDLKAAPAPLNLTRFYVCFRTDKIIGLLVRAVECLEMTVSCCHCAADPSSANYEFGLDRQAGPGTIYRGAH
jgi:hypothetical protein